MFKGVNHIYLITDCTDVAATEMQAIIASKANTDVSVNVAPVEQFSLINCSFILRLIAEVAPSNSILAVIVGPLKERRELVVGKLKKKNLYFISPNTGVLGWLIDDFECEELVEIAKTEYIPFGGKHMLAPTVAKIINGSKLTEIETEFTKVVGSFPLEKIRNLEIEDGTILHIDNFGLIKFKGSLTDAKNGDRFSVNIRNKEIEVVYWERMMDRNSGEWVIYRGSSFGLPEIGKVRENGAIEIGAKIGDKITFKKIS